LSSWDTILLAFVVDLIGGGTGLKGVDVASRKSPTMKTTKYDCFIPFQGNILLKAILKQEQRSMNERCPHCEGRLMLWSNLTGLGHMYLML
jgi:DNA-directed RNA polymerase subunit RPC12/RpoP